MLGSTTKPSFGRCNIKQNKKFAQLVEELKEWKGKNGNSVYPSARTFAELPSTSEDWLNYRTSSFWHAYSKACEIAKKELGEGESGKEKEDILFYIHIIFILHTNKRNILSSIKQMKKK